MPRTYCECKNISNKLIELGFELKGVPGFFLDKRNEWTMICKEGFLIPIRNLENRIVFLQIRLTKKEGKRRYIFIIKQI